MTTQELRAALIAAFPPAPLTAELIHAPDASWTSYEEFAALAQLEGQLWTELTPEVLERHGALLVHAGSALYRAILPAYLMLLVEREYYTILPFHVASQVTRKDHEWDRKIFDARVGPMTPEQRAIVRSVIAFLATRPPMQESMSVASRSW